MKPQQDIEENITLLHEKVKNLMSENKSDVEIADELTKEGIGHSYAFLIIENVKTELSDKTEFRKELTKGILFTCFGVLLNVVSYIAFANMGSFFWFLYWGIIVLGITLITRAYIIFKK